MDRWRGRVALVTGASAGIGRALTIRLLNQGLNVVACARRVQLVEQIKEEMESGEHVGELMAVKCDISKEEEILAMFKQVKASKFGGIDVCINNAGIVSMHKLAEGSTEIWKKMLDVNVLGLSICTREALKSMKERGVDDGHIVHISSLAAWMVLPPISFYCATKHAVRALTEGLRLELLAEKSKIRVTEICPGLVLTDIYKAAEGEETHNKIYQEVNDWNLKYMKIDDVVDSVVYVLSAPKHVQVQDVILQAIENPAD